MRPEHLGAVAVTGALDRLNGFDRALVDDVVMGCAFPEGPQGMNVTRAIVQKAGLPNSVPGVTVNRFCSSGLQTIAQAHNSVLAGQAATLERRADLGFIGASVYCAGGTGSTEYTDAYRYDPAADTWSPLPELPLEACTGMTGIMKNRGEPKMSPERMLSLPSMTSFFWALKAVASSLKYWISVPGSGPS